MVPEQFLTLIDTRKELRQLISQWAYKSDSHFKTPSKIVEAYFDFLEISLKHQVVKLAGELLYDTRSPPLSFSIRVIYFFNNSTCYTAFMLISQH